MKLKFELPELSSHPDGFPGFWIKHLFMDSQFSNFKIRSIVVAFVSSVEHARAQYRHGRTHTLAFWNHQGGGVQIGSLLSQSAYFESSVTNGSRAIRCAQALTVISKDEPALASAFDKPLNFTSPDVSGRIRKIRNTIQHADEHIVEGKIKEGEPFVLLPGGPEVPIVAEPGQTLKTIDRMEIGGKTMLFSEWCAHLDEMGAVCEALAT